MWTVERTSFPQSFAERVVVNVGGHALSFGEVITRLREDGQFRAFFVALLAATPYPAFFWETPPVRRGHLDSAYEHVTIRGDALTRIRPDSRAFASALESVAPSRSVVTFRNLGGDALLVAPKQIAALESYGHLGGFVRSAPPEQHHEFFRTLARAIEEELAASNKRIWVSTSGLGVPWLHVRIDTFPKYYIHLPYKNMSV